MFNITWTHSSLYTNTPHPTHYKSQSALEDEGVFVLDEGDNKQTVERNIKTKNEQQQQQQLLSDNNACKYNTCQQSRHV